MILFLPILSEMNPLGIMKQAAAKFAMVLT